MTYPTSYNSDETKSVWMEVSLPVFPMLESNIKTDVCIVGAGIAGLTCAYTLAKKGKSVIVIDQGSIAGGQTARTTAHLTWSLEDRYFNLEKFFGEDGIKKIADSHSKAIDYIENIVREEEIDCDFERVDGYLFLAPEDSKDTINKEFSTLQKIEKEIFKIDTPPLGFIKGPCIKFPGQGQFHILKYIEGLLKAISKYEGKIYSATHINQFNEDNNLCILKTQSGYKITANSAIVATCTPVNNRLTVHSKQAAYRTYAIAASIPKNSIPKALYWDTEDPYHYVRLQNHLKDPSLDWLIVGGEDHKTGQALSEITKYDFLIDWAKKRFPMIKKVEYQWSGQVFESMDSIGFIGKNPGDKNIFIATGDSGNGMTHATIAGILIPDLILGKENPWESLYQPSRKTLSAGETYISENLNTLQQYFDWFTDGEKKQLEGLKVDEGIIIRKGLKKIAVYKDKQDNLHFNSAFCPHLAGCVRWNSSEKSWDCPCHGSRFNGYGHFINGPANRDLYPCDESKDLG